MPKITYSGLRDEDFAPDAFENNETRERIATTLCNSVQDMMKKNFGDAHKCYDRVFVGDVTVEKALSIMGVEPQMKGYDEKAALFLASSQLQGKEIKALPLNAQNAEPESFQKVESSGFFPDPANKPQMNFFQKLCNRLFGAYQEQMDRVNEWAKDEQNRKQLITKLDNAIVQKAIEPKLAAQKEELQLASLKDSLLLDGALFKDVNKQELINHSHLTPNAKMKPNTHLNNMERIMPGKIREGTILNSSLLGDHGNFIYRSWKTLATCMMLRDGSSMEEIANPQMGAADHSETGKKMLDLIGRIASKDETVSMKAQKELAEHYIEGAKLLLKQPAPTAEMIKNSEQDECTRRTMRLIGDIGHDLFQEFSRGITQDMAKEANVYSGVREMCSSCSGLIRATMLGRESVQAPPRGIVEHAVAKDLHKLYDLSGKTMADFALNNPDKDITTTFITMKAQTLIQDIEDNKIKLRDVMDGTIEPISFLQSKFTAEEKKMVKKAYNESTEKMQEYVNQQPAPQKKVDVREK